MAIWRTATLLFAMDTLPHHPLFLYRTMRHMTRAQLALQIGCSTRTLSRWEKGHYSPRLAFAVRANHVTGLSVETLSGVVQPPVVL
jgi:DNA-binding XRE family transcriptional regulator